MGTAPAALHHLTGEHVHQQRLPAMGTACHVVVVGAPAAAVATATARVEDLERRWSRFRPDSEISRLNGAGGRPVRVSPETMLLLDVARTAWRDTGGRFDPTVLPWLQQAGYDDDLALVRARRDEPRDRRDRPDGNDRPVGPAPTPGLARLDLDRPAGTATLPADVAFDPGGIGKGLAADLVVAELVDAGVPGALVSLGGDLRVDGEPPDGDAWGIDVSPAPDVAGFGVAIRSGGVATSTIALRRWRQAGREQHHVIDPTTGRPVVGGPVAATVVAGRAWRAEAVATALLVAPWDGGRSGAAAGSTTVWGSGLATGPGTAAVVVGADGRRQHVGAIEEYLR